MDLPTRVGIDDETWSSVIYFRWCKVVAVVSDEAAHNSSLADTIRRQAGDRMC